MGLFFIHYLWENKSMNKKWLIIALSLFALAILLGAFGAHGLKPLVQPNDLLIFEVAVRYQFYGSFFLMGLAYAYPSLSLKNPAIPVLFFMGLILFSGSLYGIVLGHWFGFQARWLGPVTPVGGVLMVFSVCRLMVFLYSSKQK